MNDDTLREKLAGIVLHDEDCTVPDPEGCSCGALLARINLKSLVHQYAQAYAESIIGKPKDIQVSNSQLREAIDNSESEGRDYVVITLNRTSQRTLNNEKKGKL